MDIYVDGILVGTINEQTSVTQFQQRWDFAGLLTPGKHTLTLVTKNKLKTYVSLDEIIIR